MAAWALGRHGPEVFTAGSFGNVEQADILLNVQHDRSRVLARAPGTMSLVDTQSPCCHWLPNPQKRPKSETHGCWCRRAFCRAYQLSSIRIEEEHRNGLRVISKAELVGVAVVDRPAYPASTVEARALMGRTLRVLHANGKKAVL